MNHTIIRAIARLNDLPTMRDVCDLLPGETQLERAASIGISKQALNSYIIGTYEPDRKRAALIAKHTGIPVRALRAIAAWNRLT